LSDLSDLYQEIVLDHNSKPRNYRAMDDHNRSAEGFNPLCGDRVLVYLKVNRDVIEDAAFQGTGCAISRASTSMMTDALKGMTVQEAEHLFDSFRHQLTGDRDLDEAEEEELGDLEAFAGIRDYPSRVKCAGLGWHTLRAALRSQSQTTTE